MFKVIIKRREGSEASLKDHLQPSDILEYEKKSSWVPKENGTVWEHKTYAFGKVVWTLLGYDRLECTIDGGDPDDDWQLWGALSGYLVSHDCHKNFSSIELTFDGSEE